MNFVCSKDHKSNALTKAFILDKYCGNFRDKKTTKFENVLNNLGNIHALKLLNANLNIFI